MVILIVKCQINIVIGMFVGIISTMALWQLFATIPIPFAVVITIAVAMTFALSLFYSISITFTLTMTITTVGGRNPA